MKRYEKYKDSGIEWIGEIPEHWKVRKLKYLITNNDGGVWGNDGGNLYVLRSTEINVDGSWNYENEPAKRDLSDSEFNKSILKEGDLLITKSSGSELHIGKTGFVNRKIANMKCCFSNFMQRIRPKNNQNSNLLFHYLNSNLAREQYNYLSNTTTGLANLSAEIIANVLVPNPPTLDEQIAIANYLDQKTAEIDELIKQKVALLLLFEEEKTAIINHAVTKGIDHNVKLKDSKIEWLGEIPEHWEVKKLKYVANIVLGKMLTSEDKGEYFLKPYLRAANLNWLSANVDDVKEMWFSEKELVKYRIDNNDLLVSEGGEVGRTCIWKSEINECYIQNSVHKVTINKNNDPAFFLYQFYSFGEKGSFDAIVNRISIAHLTVEKLKEILFLVPTKEEQEQIVKFINSESKRIEKKVDLALNLIELLKQYKTALISEVATGKVKVI